MVIVDVPEKTTTSKPTTTRKPSTTTKPNLDENNPVVTKDPVSCTEQFASHVSDCNKYYLCDNGRPLVQSCPPDLYWNNNQKNCDWPRNVDCGEKTVIDSNRPTVSPRPTTTTTRKPRPKPPTDIVPPTEDDDGKYKIVCYFSK